jgi:hypothetical protein
MPGYRKLMREGGQAKAVVIASDAIAGTVGVWGAT